ncbi:hypothetical protein [Paenibacillus popilliae]|uniref:hypothetical protein n=1 Tax=Paenibacillus popilliae TaxID=78057 RepID=UPI0011D18A04|nr:hypothetical protein [Paenibacillus popilliae]
MEFETAWEKALCRLFFGASKEKAYSKQSGWNIRLKKCSCETNRIILAKIICLLSPIFLFRIKKRAGYLFDNLLLFLIFDLDP